MDPGNCKEVRSNAVNGVRLPVMDEDEPAWLSFVIARYLDEDREGISGKRFLRSVGNGVFFHRFFFVVVIAMYACKEKSLLDALGHRSFGPECGLV